MTLAHAGASPTWAEARIVIDLACNVVLNKRQRCARNVANSASQQKRQRA